MFNRYTFEDPANPSLLIHVGGWGYVAAGLAGAFYVFLKAGRQPFNAALVRQISVLCVLVFTIFATSELPASAQVVALMVLIPGLLAFQSLWMVRIIRKTLQERGWIVDASV